MTQDSKSNGVSRRGFAAALALIGPSAKVLAQEAEGGALPREKPEVSPFQEIPAFTRKQAPVRVHPFPMTAVRLAPGPFHDAQEWNRGVLHRLPVDRLVHNFRVNAGFSFRGTPRWMGEESRWVFYLGLRPTAL